MATLKAFEGKDLQNEDKYPTTAFGALRKKILEKHPQLAKETPKEARRQFDRIARKMRLSLPFKTWREMDRFIKGDRYGLAR